MKRAVMITSTATLLACATAQPGPAASTTAAGKTRVEVENDPQTARQSPPPSGAPREVQFPPIQRAHTKSGLEVNTVPLDQLPIVQIKLVIKSGSAADPSSLPGVAQLTAAMLKEGTHGKSSAKLAEAIDFLGANMHVHSDEENIYISMSALSEHFEEALALVAEVATRPAFSQRELEKLKTREAARLAMESENPRFLAARELHKALYGEHPYWHVDTTPAVLKRVKREDLARFHRTHFAPNNAALIVVGQVEPEQVQDTAQKVFAKWKRRNVPEVEYPKPPARDQREVIIVDREQSVQSVFYIGNLALPRKSDDYIPLMVANQVLGGSAASRLFMDLREKRSLTYGAYSFVGESVKVAPFIAYAAVRNEVTGEAMAAFEEHLERIVTEPPPAEELKDAQAFLVDRFPLRIDTPGKIADLVVDLRVHDLPDDYWDSFREQIRAVDPGEALAAAREYIGGDRGVIVVVGKAADIKPALEKYGPVTVLDTAGELVLGPEANAKTTGTASTGAPAPAGDSNAPAPAGDNNAPAAAGDNKE